MERDLQEAQNYNVVDKSLRRRQFLIYSGLTAAAATLAACKKDAATANIGYVNDGLTIDFKNDVGLLNTLYACCQLQVAFCNRLAELTTLGWTTVQVTYLNEIRLHELAHSEFFKSFLGVTALSSLSFDFPGIDFSSKEATLTAAANFQNLAVAASNGILARCTERGYLVIVAQIATVEARHAAWLQEQIAAGSSSDLGVLQAWDADAERSLDVAVTPEKALELMKPYMKTELQIVNK